ncbi:MAG: cytidylyltransferase domain-containing protein [Porticoccaceae bacterium]
MKVVALIPARAGSKRLPGKNKRLLAGRSLVEWSILCAEKTGVFSDILVSTDDNFIADIASNLGYRVPNLRPPILSTDTASSAEMAIYELDKYEKKEGPVDILVLLQPTSPFRKASTIIGAINLMHSTNADSVISVDSSLSKGSLYFYEDAKDIMPVFGWDFYSSNEKSILRLNGGVFLVKPQALRKHKTFVFPGFKPFVIEDPIESLDIDTQSDWDIALSLADDFLNE